MIRFLLLRVHCLILSVVNASVVTDRRALLVLRAHVSDDPTNGFVRNWSTSSSVCNWMGVTCNGSSHRVTSLNVSNFGLTGTIPSQLGNLSALESLDFSHNQFSGTIPSSIFNISTLKALSFRDNQLSGAFPSFTSNESSLRHVDFTYNRLSGELPSDICSNLYFLSYLALSKNMFRGQIRTALSKCKHLQKVSLSYNEFSGAVPKELGNFTNLKELYLGFNRLQGEIPQELGSLAKLEVLDLSNNFLLTGAIPSSIFNLSSVIELDFSNDSLTGSFPDDMCRGLPLLYGLYMSGNRFTGPIPGNLWQCTSLVDISLSFNQFTGNLPRYWANLTSLRTLYLGYNKLQGTIPHEIGYLQNLEELQIGQNRLDGVVPDSIFNMSTLISLGVQNNSLFGILPSSPDIRLSNLEELYMWGNYFSGPLPSFIFNASKLSLLSLGDNFFSGIIPNTFGNLKELEKLSLLDNFLTSSTPNLSFISSLSDCKNLIFFDLSSNPLNGILPRSVGNLSNSLEAFFMSDCNISGRIPEEIRHLTNMITLDLGGNKLNGTIPIIFEKTEKLQYLSLRDNKLEGSIPDDVCRLTALFQLELQGNKLSGSIPTCFGNMSSLRTLSLSSNELSSSVPLKLWNLKGILSVNLSSNFLSGPLPLEIGNLKVLVGLDLSLNNFSSVIPATIGGLKDLQYLLLEYNRLQGSIPDSVGELTSLKSLNLSNNNLSGQLPLSLEKLQDLKNLNLSFNRLEGMIPREGPFVNLTAKSFMGNDLLCGSRNLQVPPCKNNKTNTHGKSRKRVLLLGIVLPSSIGLVIVVVLALRFLLISRCQKRNMKSPNDDNTSPPATIRRFSYLALLRATNDFSEHNLLGRGSFGTAYKARLEDGLEVVVKVFHEHFERAWASFEVECEVMKATRHRNLVKIISSCSNEEFRAIILEYMPNGSLEDRLYLDNSILDIFQRLNIMIDVASALEYLHFGRSDPIIHCDLKPSNVLLDVNMVARLGDFGIAKLLTGEDQSTIQTQTLATIGYMAPEYGREGQVSTKVDVYSFGIMLMETFVRKKPTDEIFTGEMSLKRWVNDFKSISVMNIVDGNILSREDEHFASKCQCLSSIFKLALECTEESPEKRINSKEILAKLLKIRNSLLRNVEGSR